MSAPRPAGAALGIAGVNTRPLHGAALGIAGNLGSTLRPALARATAPAPAGRGTGLGDRASREAWRHAVWLLDYTFLTCPDRAAGGMRLRAGPGELAGERRFPLYLDSAAYREFTGRAPRWSSYAAYCQAIDLTRPQGAMAKDVVGDQAASRAGYQRMCADGYRDVAIPVFQLRESFLWTRSPREPREAYLADACRQAVRNGRLAARDPVLREYVERAPLVAVGGLARCPCPPEACYLYLAELCRAFPGARFWALAQASAPVVNGLGRLGLLDRVSLDGTWWLHHAATEQLAVLQDGELRSIKLARTGARDLLPPRPPHGRQPGVPARRLRRAVDLPGPPRGAHRDGGRRRPARAAPPPRPRAARHVRPARAGRARPARPARPARRAHPGGHVMSDTPAPPALPPPPAPSTVLPRGLERVLLTDFPPGNPRAGGFSHSLVEAMRRADPYNLLRLLRAFPVYGIAFVLWDTGLVVYERGAEGHTTAVRLVADPRLAAARALRLPTSREQLDAVRAVGDPARTRVDGRQLTDRDLARRLEFGV